MSWMTRGYFIAALALVFVVSFITPGAIGLVAENFAGVKMFIWTGGLVAIVWLGMELDAANKAETRAAARKS